MEIAITLIVLSAMVLVVDNYRLRGRLERKEQSNEMLRQRVETLARRIEAPSPVDDTSMAFVKHLSALARKDGYDVLEADLLETEEIQ